MKWFPRILAVGLVSVLVAIGCSRPPTPEEISAQEQVEVGKVKIAETSAMLDELIIPKLKLTDLSPFEALSLIHQTAISVDAQKREVMNPEEWKKSWEKSPSVRQLRFYVNYGTIPFTDSPLSNMTLSTELTDASLRSALDTLAGIIGLQVEVQAGGVLFHEKN
jgi:hypothetical protein